MLYRAVVPETQNLFRHEKFQEWIVPADGTQAPRAILQKRNTPAWMVFSADGRSLLFPEKGALHSMDVSGADDKVVVENFPAISRDPQVSADGLIAVIAARPDTAPTDIEDVHDYRADLGHFGGEAGRSGAAFVDGIRSRNSEQRIGVEPRTARRCSIFPMTNRPTEKQSIAGKPDSGTKTPWFTAPIAKSTR